MAPAWGSQGSLQKGGVLRRGCPTGRSNLAAEGAKGKVSWVRSAVQSWQSNRFQDFTPWPMQSNGSITNALISWSNTYPITEAER